MTDLLAARSQMAMSLAFHIVFAAVGIGMPLLMVLAEAAWMRTGEPVYLELAKRWSKGTAILFAVGAVSGTVLSFELGLLWPRFMEHAGPIVGMPFSLEGFAFFTEAIFLGIYLYGWKQVSKAAHLASGVMVLISGTLSGAFVVCANAWMNTPAGFRIEDGRAVDIDPFAAMMNPSAPSEVLHMTAAAFTAVGFLVAGIHAFLLLRDKTNLFHRRALAIALAVAIPCGLFMPATGHVAAQHVAETQPAKLAAMEAHWETEAWAGFRIGGWPDEEAEETRWSIVVPGMLSVLAFDDPEAVVVGLKDIAEDERPPVPVVHMAFQLMIASGVIMAATAGVGLLLVLWRRRLPDDDWYLRLLVMCTPLGMLAIEAGWTVTEVGRQPWIVRGFLRTADAVTPMPGLVTPFLTFTAIYALLGLVVASLLLRMIAHSPYVADEASPGGTK
jgi:cytochrome d ubiquinol oxidase subunit I